MAKLLVMCVVAFTCLFVSVADAISTKAFVPLWSSENMSTTDTFLTVSESEHAYALSLGFANRGIAGWLLPTGSGFDSRTQPFARYYKGSPETDHFYTTSASEQSYVTGLGWAFEGVEGDIYPSQVDSSQDALHRLSYWWPATGDLQHLYTTSNAGISTLVSQGWTYDGVAGYLWVDPSQTTGGTANMYKVGSQYYVTVPGVYDHAQFNGIFFGTCGGTLEIINALNGSVITKLFNFSYGIMPGTQGTYGCSQSVNISTIQYSSLRLRYSGYVANVSGTYVFFPPQERAPFAYPF